MWILLRLTLALVGFFWRFRPKSWPIDAPLLIDGESVFKVENRNKYGVTSIDVGLACPGKIYFKISEEGACDRLFKQLGLSSEFQTGDSSFDETFYIASDHWGFARQLQLNAELRALVAKLFAKGAKMLHLDAHHLWVKLSPGSDAEAAAHDVVQIKKLLAPLLASCPSAWRDYHVAKVIFIEAIVWSLFGYAGGAAIDFQFRSQDIYLEKSKILAHGLGVAVLLLAALLGLIVLFLRGSSRAHRVIVESAIGLGLALPVVGMQLLVDCNENFTGNQASVPIERIVLAKEERRRRKSGTVYSLVLGKGDETDMIPLPTKLRVPYSLYLHVQTNSRVKLNISRGRLGYLFIQDYALYE